MVRHLPCHICFNDLSCQWICKFFQVVKNLLSGYADTPIQSPVVSRKDASQLILSLVPLKPQDLPYAISL